MFYRTVTDTRIYEQKFSLLSQTEVSLANQMFGTDALVLYLNKWNWIREETGSTGSQEWGVNTAKDLPDWSTDLSRNPYTN
jgi:hypothetical protein